MSSFLTVCNYTFKLRVRRILKLMMGWIARMWEERGIRNRLTNHLSAEFDGDRCDVEYLQETAGVLLIAMLNMQVFTNSCTTHVEDITSAKVYLDCSGWIPALCLGGSGVESWLWSLIAYLTVFVVCNKISHGRSFNHAAEVSSWNQSGI
jgi:hypothetical protein